jgi:hypothetical protein
MSKDEKLLQHVFDLFHPLVRDGWTVDRIVDAANRTTFFFVNGASVYLKKSEFTVDHPAPTVLTVPLKRMARRRTGDGSYAWRLFDRMNDVVSVIGLSQPTDPLPVFVSRMRETLVGSRVQSVSASDGGLCLHLDDDYDAVSNGASRVRIDANRVPFTVGCVDVNSGDGFDMLRICASDRDDRKPVVMFRLDQDILNGKELSFDVI